jgi:nickel transport protein
MLICCRWCAGHELRLFAEVEGNDVVGRAYFEGAGSVAGASIMVLGPENEVLRELITGPEGRFRFPIEQRVPHHLRVRTVDLHQADAMIGMDQLPAVVSSGLSTNPVSIDAERAALQREVTRLKEEIDQLQHSVRPRDVVGGIGMIMGVFGLWCLFRRGKR